MGKHIINPFKPIATNYYFGELNPPDIEQKFIMTEEEAKNIAISLGLKLEPINPLIHILPLKQKDYLLIIGI